VKFAFLNGYLHKGVYVKKTPSFEDSNKLLDWYERLNKSPLDSGFKRGKVNKHWLSSPNKNISNFFEFMLIKIIFGQTNHELCKKFSDLMSKEFEMRLVGELNFFLALQLMQC